METENSRTAKTLLKFVVLDKSLLDGLLSFSSEIKIFDIIFAGILLSPYNATFKSKHQLCLSIMKRFGFGQRVMETRILTEVEEMISKVREKQGRPFDMRQLTTSCVANVIMSMLFGRRFDHSDVAFQQLVSNVHYLSANFSIALHLFPVLRFLPPFKTSTAKKIKAVKSSLDFVKNNIAACTQVCGPLCFFANALRCFSHFTRSTAKI